MESTYFSIHWQGVCPLIHKFTRRVSKFQVEEVYGDIPVTLPLPGVLPAPALRKVYSLTLRFEEVEYNVNERILEISRFVDRRMPFPTKVQAREVHFLYSTSS